MALALAHRLRRLEAFREVAGRLMERPQLNRDVFARGTPEPIAEIKQPEWTATLYDLLSAYAVQRSRSALSHVRFKKRTVWSLAEARAALERLIGMLWDIGLEISHSVRTVEACSEAAGADITIRTALLEARYLAGGREVFRRLQAELAQAIDLQVITEAPLTAGDYGAVRAALQGDCPAGLRRLRTELDKDQRLRRGFAGGVG